MRTDEKKILGRYVKCLKLIHMSSDMGGTVLYEFIDAQNNHYTHYQVNPNTCKPNSQSKARLYLINLTRVHNMQSENKVTYTDLIPDALNNMQIGGYNTIGSYFLVDCCEREMKDGRVYYNAEYISDSFPSKFIIEKFENSEIYKADVLKKRKEESQLEYAARLYTEYKTFYKEEK